MMIDPQNRNREGEASAEPALSRPNSTGSITRHREGEASAEPALSRPNSAGSITRHREGEASAEPALSRPNSASSITRHRVGEASAKPALSRPNSTGSITRHREGEASAEPALSRANSTSGITRHREDEASAEPAVWRPVGWHDPRKHPAHGVIPSADDPTIVFVTICTKERKKWLADGTVENQLLSAWNMAKGWIVGRYVIMPDHVHSFAGWDGREWDLDRWCKYWKALFSKIHQNREHRWQTGHWDTRMKTYDQFQSKWDYVRDNPVRHQLVTKADDWPFQGVLHEFGPW